MWNGYDERQFSHLLDAQHHDTMARYILHADPVLGDRRSRAILILNATNISSSVYIVSRTSGSNNFTNVFSRK